MLVFIWTRDDETGLLDDEFKDGDVFRTEPDSFESSLGNQEKKSYLVLKIPDPPNISKVMQQIVQSEYRTGSTPDAPHVIRRKRFYTLDWRVKFTESEIALIESANDVLPDGQTSQGGTVTLGVVSDLFTIDDFRRK